MKAKDINPEVVLDIVEQNNRVCPNPRLWNSLYEIIQDDLDNNFGNEPPRPMILAAWRDTPPSIKKMVLVEQIKWAAENGTLDKAYHYLHDLNDDDWFTG